MHWIDPDFLPETSGVMNHVLLNPDAEVDGIVLTDGMEVHFPPHMGDAVLRVVTPGSKVRVRGVRPRGVAMIAAVAVGPEEGPLVVDAGPPDHHDREAAREASRASRTRMEAEGVLRQTLHGPKGEVRGVLLEDGCIGRFPPHSAEGLAGLLRPGNRLFFRGQGISTRHGTVIAVHDIGPSANKVQHFRPKPKKPKRR
jgi:hypothetical protein